MRTKIKTCTFIMLCIAFCILAAVSVSAAEKEAYLGDEIVFALDNAHNVTADGGSSLRNMTTMRAGEFVDERYRVRKLAARTGNISFDMAVSGEDVSLEIEEIHNKSEVSYGYYVNVEGTDVFLRAGAETSVGPQHFFVKVPGELTRGKRKIRVTLRNVSDSAVSINRIWAHSNLKTLCDEEGITTKMPVIILNGDFFNVNWNAYKGKKEDYREALRSYIETFGDESNYKNFIPGYAIEITYMRWPDERVYEMIDAVVELSSELNVPIAINFNSWWGGTPSFVPDGKGGFFTDLEYQELIYAPNNINGRGVYQTTTPNSWGNNPWLSLNNEHMNNVRLEKYRKFCKYMNQKITEMKVKAGDRKLPEVSVFIENEPQYWTLFLFTTQEIREVCDSSQTFVNALKEKYGVDFDPTDWLDEDEQEALFYNLSDYTIDLMKAAAEGAGTDYITVNGNKIKLPDDQFMDNIYTHQFDTNIEKRIISEWDTYETALVKNGNLGMEGYGLSGNVANRNMGAHAAARGKFAAVNIETGGNGTSIGPLDDYYAAGAHYGVLFNAQRGVQPILAKMDETVMTEGFEEPFEGREIFRYDVKEDDTFEPDGILVEADGIGVSPMHRNYVACPHDDDYEGSLTFRVDNKGKPFTNGLEVMLYGYCWAHMDPNCRMEVYAGSDLNNLTLADTKVIDVGGVPCDISSNIDKTKSVAYFKVRIFTTGNREWSGVFRIRALEKFGETLGHTNGYIYSFADSRLNSLIVTNRADVETMLDEQKAYCANHPDYIEAARLYKEGKYKSAKKLLLGTASLKMPAKFMVVDYGKLADYPVKVDVAEDELPVSVILRELGDTVRFEIGAERNVDVTLSFYEKQGRYTLSKEGEEYILSKSGNGEYTAHDGVVTLNLTAGRPVKEYPKQFTGFTGYQPWQTENVMMISFHDPKLSNYSYGTFFEIADDAKFFRGPADAKCNELEEYPREKLTELHHGERVDVTLNDEGKIQKVNIRYGLVNGVVTAFTEAKFPEMISPYMEVTENGTGKKWLFKIDSLTDFNTSKTGGANTFLASNPGKSIGFKVGNIVSVSYIPLKAGNEDYYYATNISEDYITVYDENLNDASYREKIYSESNVQVAPLDGNNLDIVGLAAVGSTGYVVWKVEADSPIKEIAVNYSGRAIMGSTVEILVSANGYIYDKISDLKDIFFHNVNQVFTCYSDDEDIVNGNVIYVKAKFDVQAATTWGFLNSIQIQIKV